MEKILFHQYGKNKNNMREQLIRVFTDTVSHIENGEYNKDLHCSKNRLSSIELDSDLIKKPGVITVENLDCIEVASRLSKEGKTCMLNMASYKKPGGGVKSGAMAQEEELARRSNLMYGLPQEFYPLSIDEYIYTQDVTFFKNKYYQVIPSFDCDIITIAAINRSESTPANYEEIMEEKISNMLYIPYKNGCKNLVLSAFGCGVFKNDPHFVSELFKSLLDSGFSSLYSRVSFAILNDRNSVGSNYQIFKETLLN